MISVQPHIVNRFCSNQAKLALLEGEPEDYVSPVFLRFCPSGEMDSKTFAKFCRDTKLLDKKFTTTDADLTFQKTRAQLHIVAKTINFESFRQYTLPEIAAKRRVDLAEVISRVAVCEGPTLNGVTQADAVRLHDDKDTYTGTIGYNYDRLWT